MRRFNLRVLRRDEAGLAGEMAAIGVDPRGSAIMVQKGQFWLVKAEQVPFAAANILKQEALAKGGEAALSGEIYRGGERASDVLLMGTERTLRRVAHVLGSQPLPSLQQFASELSQVLDHVGKPALRPCTIAGREFCWGARTYVMGIVNATPDSFSGDGLLAAQDTPEQATERAVQQALTFLAQGADIIDIGGESTRPGSQPMDAETELARVIPAIRQLRAVSDAPISIDTYKAVVARAALEAGADLVNDVWGLQMDPELAPLIAERGVPVVIMHNRSKPKDAAQETRLGGRYVGVHYQDLLADILRELDGQVEAAIAAGIPCEQIIIDPGIGFGKTVEQNLALLNHVDELRALGLPILLGPSRKAFIGYTLDLPPDQRLEGTLAAVAVGIVRGVDLVRVHDVQATVRLAHMADAILRAH